MGIDGTLVYPARVPSRFASLTASFTQFVALRALEAAALRPRRSVALAYPRSRIVTGGTPIAGLYAEVFVRALYESPKPLPRRPRIVDAGGHLGLASLYFLHTYPDCQLTTVEPNPNLTACLRDTLAPFKGRVRLLEAALSTAAGFVTFHITADAPLNVTGGISNRESPERAVNQLRVPSVDAHVVLAEPVDLMKLDVEGHEFELLQLPLFVPNHVRNLVVEFHDIDKRREQFAELMQCLRERGYRVASDENLELRADEVLALSGCPVLKLY